MEDEAAITRLDQVWRTHVGDAPRVQLERWRQREADTEHRLSIPTPSSQRLLVMICERYGLRLYRQRRQRSSTLCVKAPPGFMHEVLWPVFEQMAMIVEEVAAETTTRIMERWVQRGGEEQRI